MLHTLSHSPWQCDFEAMLRQLREGDDVLLIQDGVLAGLLKTRFLELLLAAPISLYALEADVEARGLSAQISNSVGRVSYNDFVSLTVKHRNQIAW